MLSPTGAKKRKRKFEFVLARGRRKYSAFKMQIIKCTEIHKKDTIEIIYIL